MQDDTHRARPLAAAGALFLDGDGHVLIVEPVYKPMWEIPGGYVERGETPRVACLRELREELGMEQAVGRLLVVDWAVGTLAEPDERVRFLFDGGVLPDERLDAIVLPPDELASWACVPADELFVMLPPPLVRRVDAALGARAAGETWYLEEGVRA